MSEQVPSIDVVHLFEDAAFKAERRAQRAISEALRLKRKAAKLRYQYERNRLSVGAAQPGPRELMA